MRRAMRRPMRRAVARARMTLTIGSTVLMRLSVHNGRQTEQRANKCTRNSFAIHKDSSLGYD